MLAHPNFWTDGNQGEELDALISVAVSGAFVRSVPWVFDGRVWGPCLGDASRIFSMVRSVGEGGSLCPSGSYAGAPGS